jgi:6,7-dimethyl-8-ribityllumazine synthase
VKPGDRAKGAAPDCSGRRFAIVAARFYVEIANQLIAGAEQALRECGVAEADVRVYDVPGCFELPLACLEVIDGGGCDALVALGAVVRGETPHFDYVAGECARGIMEVQLATRVPIGFGVLTTETLVQAQERADPQRGNKGFGAAMAAASLLTLSVA